MMTQVARWALALLVVRMLALPGWAEEVTVKNDSLTNGALGVIQAGFDPGESAAAWLTAPCTGDIVAVQVYWLSLYGALPSIEDSITVFSEGNFPVPGPVMQNGIPPYQDVILEGPVMTEGAANEFRYLDEAGAVEMKVPIEEGEVFVVSFKFYNDPDPNEGPSVVTDYDGCQWGKNGIDAIGLGWVDSCLLGVSGDFFIRAVIDCQGVTGACCHATGVCENEVEEEDCQAFGDTWHEGQGCGEITCNARGACCKDGGCLTLVEPGTCTAIGGVYAGDGTDCTDDVCVAGACCITETGACIQNFEFQCVDLGGDFLGHGVSCDPNPCPQPTGACCFGTICVPDQTEEQCTDTSGVWAGAWTDCSDLDMDGTADVCQDPCIGQERGDCNADGSLNGLDIDPFVDALINPGQFNTEHDPLKWECVADINCDGSMNGLDIDPFVGCLTGGCPACP